MYTVLILQIMRMNDNWILYEILYHVIVEQHEPESQTNLELCKGNWCSFLRNSTVCPIDLDIKKVKKGKV